MIKGDAARWLALLGDMLDGEELPALRQLCVEAGEPWGPMGVVAEYSVYSGRLRASGADTRLLDEFYAGFVEPLRALVRASGQDLGGTGHSSAGELARIAARGGEPLQYFERYPWRAELPEDVAQEWRGRLAALRKRVLAHLDHYDPSGELRAPAFERLRERQRVLSDKIVVKEMEEHMREEEAGGAAQVVQNVALDSRPPVRTVSVDDRGEAVLPRGGPPPAPSDVGVEPSEFLGDALALSREPAKALEWLKARLPVFLAEQEAQLAAAEPVRSAALRESCERARSAMSACGSLLAWLDELQTETRAALGALESGQGPGFAVRVARDLLRACGLADDLYVATLPLVWSQEHQAAWLERQPADLVIVPERPVVIRPRWRKGGAA